MLNTQSNYPCQMGVVVRKNGAVYHVRSDGVVISCTLSSKLSKQPFEKRQEKGKHCKDHTKSAPLTLDPLAVGDHVRIIHMGADAIVIVEIFPRRNQLSRPTAVPMPGAHAFEQVFAANVDQVIPIFSAVNPAPKWNMLDRYLVCAGAANVPALICITKSDMVRVGEAGTDELMEISDEYRRIGYPVLFISAISGEGLDELKDALKGNISVLVGKSGVGKTTLLNALQPGLNLRVNAVSDYNGKGRHTTVHVELFDLDFGGSIVDTPGVREFGLWEVGGDELAYLFPEMRPYIGRCKFGLDCRHDEEPGCALRKGVMEGHISPRRYQSYLKLLEEVQ